MSSPSPSHGPRPTCAHFLIDVDEVALCARCGFGDGGIAEDAIWDGHAQVVTDAHELLG